MGYKYKISKTKNGYVFQLLPNNNNTQSIGESILYSTEKECLDALSKFQQSAHLFEKNTYSHKIIEKEWENKRKTFRVEWYDETGKLIFCSPRDIGTKENAQKQFQAIINNMDTEKVINK